MKLYREIKNITDKGIYSYLPEQESKFILNKIYPKIGTVKIVDDDHCFVLF